MENSLVINIRELKESLNAFRQLNAILFKKHLFHLSDVCTEYGFSVLYSWCGLNGLKEIQMIHSFIFFIFFWLSILFIFLNFILFLYFTKLY